MKQGRIRRYCIYSVIGISTAWGLHAESTLRSRMVHYWSEQKKKFPHIEQKFHGRVTVDNLNGQLGQRLSASDGLTLTVPGNTKYFESCADWWQSWKPSSRLMRYILDFDWNSGAHTRELALIVAKYVALGVGIWYLIAALRYHFCKKQKKEETEQLVRMIKHIEAEHHRHDSCYSSAT